MKKIDGICKGLIILGISIYMVSCKQVKPTDYKTDSLTVIENNSTKQWSDTLRNTGCLEVDLDGDNIEDCIRMECKEKEGESMITRFDVTYGGDETFNLCEDQEVYRAVFERLETFDFDGDGIDELILQFDGHGSGGKGYHEIMVLWPQKEHKVEKSVLLSSVSGQNQEELKNMNIDSINDFEIVLYEGKKYLRTHQYLWSMDGSHSECEGDLVSIVTLTKGQDQFVAIESYVVQ